MEPAHRRGGINLKRRPLDASSVKRTHCAHMNVLRHEAGTHGTDIGLAGQTVGGEARAAAATLSPSHPRWTRHSPRGSLARCLQFDSAR